MSNKCSTSHILVTAPTFVLLFSSRAMPSYISGVFLALSTYKGPQLVYHYFDPTAVPVNDDSEVQSKNEDVEFSDEEATPPPTPYLSVPARFANNNADQSDDETGDVSLPGGLDRALVAEILTPPQSLCNSKFSLTLGNYVYVGIPVHILDTGTWRVLKDASYKSETVITEKDSPMRLFHVCFVLRAPINDTSDAENNVYKWILVPLVRFLRNAQASENYVWKEVQAMRRACENLETMREKHRAMESSSELAITLRSLCLAAMRSEIARVSICGHQRAFQIPQLLELHTLPAWSETQPTGSYLSTSNVSGKIIEQSSHECYGLLLLNDPESIVKELSVDPRSAAAILIRSIDPTLSIAQLAKTTKIELKQIVSLMWSLVYWRRARIIQPLSTRHTYVLSPLAPLSTLHELATLYHQKFPTMPPLPKQLGLLSTGKPRPFSSHVPSFDHRHIYLMSLEWLMQHNLVVQLSTFALVVATRKIKLAASDFEHEDAQEEDGTVDEAVPLQTVIKEKSPIEIKESLHRLNILDGSNNIPSQRPRRLSPYRIDSSSEVQDTIILDPRSANKAERQWLRQISISGTSKNQHLQRLFDRLCDYFNGKDCLEQIMLKENISGEEMRAFLTEFSTYIVTYKHW